MSLRKYSSRFSQFALKVSQPQKRPQPSFLSRALISCGQAASESNKLARGKHATKSLNLSICDLNATPHCFQLTPTENVIGRSNCGLSIVISYAFHSRLRLA